VAELALANCFPRFSEREELVNGVPCFVAYCDSCHKPDSYVPSVAVRAGITHFCLCNSCGDKYGALVNDTPVAEELVWRKAKEAQLEKEGRELTSLELVKAFDDPTHYLSKIAAEMPRWSR
jgi:hypothetical protein